MSSPIKPIWKFAGGSVAGFANTSSLALDGVDEYCDGGNIHAFESNQARTFSNWVKFDSVGAGRDGIFGKIEGTALVGYFFERTSALLQFFMHSSGSTFIRVFSSAPVLSANVWHNIILTYDGSRTAAGVTFYLDGPASADTDFTDTLDTNTIIDAAQNFLVGRDRNSASGPQLLGGKMDESSVWDKVLDSPERAEVFNSGTPTDLLTHSAVANLLSWWRFGEDPSDDSTGTTGQITDVSGNGLHLTPQNTESNDFDSDTPP